MEIVAERMDGTTRCGVELPETEWLRYLTVRRPLFHRYLVVISQLFNIKVITTGQLIRIEIPNLLKKRDNYTKDLEVTSKKLPSIEVEVEKKKIKELTPTKKLKNIKKDTEPSPVKDFIEYASSTFEDKFKVPLFVEWGKDGKLVKELLGVYEFDKLREIWGAFLTSSDPFIEKAGRSIGVFKTQVNKLAQTKSTQRQVVF